MFDGPERPGPRSSTGPAQRRSTCWSSTPRYCRRWISRFREGFWILGGLLESGHHLPAKAAGHLGTRSFEVPKKTCRPGKRWHFRGNGLACDPVLVLGYPVIVSLYNGSCFCSYKMFFHTPFYKNQNGLQKIKCFYIINSKSFLIFAFIRYFLTHSRIL